MREGVEVPPHIVLLEEVSGPHGSADGPILLSDRGISAFRSVNEAAADIEPPDVGTGDIPSAIETLRCERLEAR